MSLSFHTPRFFDADYEDTLALKLRSANTLALSQAEYQRWLNLKVLAGSASASSKQLKSIIDENEATRLINEVEERLNRVMELICNNAETNETALNEAANRFGLVKDKIEESKCCLHTTNGVNLALDVFLGLSLTGSFLTCGWVFVSACMGTTLIMSGPVGAACFSAAMALIAAALLVWVAYSAYVEVRFMQGKQGDEIDAFIAELNTFQQGFIEQQLGGGEFGYNVAQDGDGAELLSNDEHVETIKLNG